MAKQDEAGRICACVAAALSGHLRGSRRHSTQRTVDAESLYEACLYGLHRRSRAEFIDEPPKRGEHGTNRIA